MSKLLKRLYKKRAPKRRLSFSMQPGGNYQSKTLIKTLETFVQIENNNTHFTKNSIFIKTDLAFYQVKEIYKIYYWEY